MSELKVKNSDEVITVQNVFCIGKNYLDHIKEFDTLEKAAEVPKEPVIFLKPNSSVFMGPGSVSIPEVDGKKISDNLQHEVELVIVIGNTGKNVPVNKAFNIVYGYAVGIDMVLRDVQNEQKKKGLPWATSKGFYRSAPISEITKKEDCIDASDMRISLYVNEDLKQDARTSHMLYKLDYIIHYISSIFILNKGDLIFTGTPAGISKLNPGDKVRAMIESLGELNVNIVDLSF